MMLICFSFKLKSNALKRAAADKQGVLDQTLKKNKFWIEEKSGH